MSDQRDQFSDVVRAMRASDAVDRSMEAAVAGAVDLIPNVRHAAVSMVRRGKKVETVAATDDLVRRGDALQYELEDGPCLQSIWEEETVQSDDLGQEHRWPLWSPRAAQELGVRSMLCLQLFVSGDTIGCLNLYSREPDAFDSHDRTAAHALAAHIAVALSAARKIENLESAVVNRTLIGQAQGMLMQRYEMDAAAAFAVLKRVSQTENRRLHEVAKELVKRGVGSDSLG
ncbi:GAF and ANTAR domain-containing protein [Aeromicrobium yanjiei]|uniref:GAF domain-containing protein n=1 Tax=Aeromicrobium yanjiei TaxID=2662028 RepID=A0A5Q2MEZ6_9ACTN|nr:GAF and ANTAR domain-containing protein [Aeromicrobium yanjiei]QGG40289.1 GAF domain-containing protein [Aeromicrobium yanjiei]